MKNSQMSKTPSINKQKQSNRNESPVSENRNITPRTNRENTNTRTKNKLRKFKEHYEWTKDYLAITKKHRIENNQDGNGKIDQVLTYISTKNITELNDIIYAGAKLVCEKIEVPL